MRALGSVHYTPNGDAIDSRTHITLPSPRDGCIISSSKQRSRERKKSEDKESSAHGNERPSSPHQHQHPQPYSETPKAQSLAHPIGHMSTLGVATPSLQRSRSPSPLHLKDLVHEVILKMRNEKNSEAHQIFRSYPGHSHKGLPQTVNPDEETVPGIQHPGSTGVIYCTDRAMANGFSYGDPAWVGDIPDAPPRPQTVNLPHDSLEYAPTTGVKELRKAVADLYNHTYRQGKKSQYTYENVCIVPGGRAGLSRVAAVIGDVCVHYCGYQVPEYTTYSEVLSVFKRLVPIPTALTPEVSTWRW
ncbi:aminotransferase [Rhizoctonia solani AG-1 IA]|uniref:Aminotransferase n=1 Tax=Thanatephorus cucumeris (strain AG1-IA) TaxID=983506 RepID=L8X8I8_THACA|nr:aminotransferase [Rhizoctonia solani AG-1 IA]